jgi:hypothetical protein
VFEAEAVPTIMIAEAVATIMEVAEEEDGLDHQALEAMEAITTVLMSRIVNEITNNVKN